MSRIYEQGDDSYLILDKIREFSKGRVLDMGTGSGILAMKAAEKADTVLAVDINKEALEYAKKKVKNFINIEFIYSDLFSNIKGKFDFIVFNAPYLPNEGLKDVALDGGKNGYEILERFFSDVGDYLEENGKILIVFSSLTKPRKVKEIIKKNNFNFKILEEKKLFFETLYLVLVERFL